MCRWHSAKNCEQVEDEKVTLREERETGIKKKWAKEEGATNSKHISKGMVLLNKHHSNAAASNWAWKRQIGWQETSQRACNSFNTRQDSKTAVRKEAWRLLSNGVVSVLRKICHNRWGKAPGAVERGKKRSSRREAEAEVWIMTERKENSSSWWKRTRSTQKASKEMATEYKTSKAGWQSLTKKTKRTAVRNFVKEFNNAKIDPKWVRNRKGDSQVEDMEGQEEELAKLEEAWGKSDMMEEEAANKRKDKKKRTKPFRRQAQVGAGKGNGNRKRALKETQVDKW